MLTIRSFVALFVFCLFSPLSPAALLLTEGKPSPDLGQLDDYALEPNHLLIYHKTGAGWDNGTAIGGGVVDGQQLFDGSHILSLDAGARQATANDGSTVAFDWSDPAGVALTVKGLLRNHVAYLGQYGDNSTGVIGDPAHPFQTAQGVITYCEAHSCPSLIIDIGNTSSTASITTSLTHIEFRGTSAAFAKAFGSIHFTSTTGTVSFSAYSCQIGSVTSDTTGPFNVQLENAYATSFTAAGSININGDQPVGLINWIVDTISAGGDVSVVGCGQVSSVSAPGFNVTIDYAKEINGSITGSVVTISGAPVSGAVTATTSLTLNDARVLGAITSPSITYNDTLLKPKFHEPANLQAYTVATLPGGNQGDLAIATDALAPAYGATVVGGGAVVTPVFFDGTNWTCH